MSLTLPRLSASLWNWSFLVAVIFVLGHGANGWSEEPRFVDHSLLIAPEYPFPVLGRVIRSRDSRSSINEKSAPSRHTILTRF
jgi:hypothetical protein